MKKISLIVGFLIIVGFVHTSIIMANEPPAIPMTDQTFVKIAEASNFLIGQLSIVLIPKQDATEKSQDESGELEDGVFDKYDPYYRWPSIKGQDIGADKDPFSKNEASSKKDLLRDQLKMLLKNHKQEQNNGDTTKEKIQKKRKKNFQYPEDIEYYKLGSGILIDKSGLFLVAIDKDGFYFGRIRRKIKSHDIAYQMTVNNKTYSAEPIFVRGEFVLWRVNGLQVTQFKPPIFSKNAQIKLGQWITIIGRYQGDPFLKIGHISRKRSDSFYIDSYGQDYDIKGGLVINLKEEIIGVIQEDYNREIRAVLIDQALITGLIKSSKSKAPKKEKGWFGVAFVQLNEGLLRYLKKDGRLEIWQRKGVMVRTYPFRSSPAERSGIERGDIIKSINDKPVNDLETVRKLIEEMPPGDILTLEVISKRTGQIRNLQVRTIKKEFYHYFFGGGISYFSGVVY